MAESSTEELEDQAGESQSWCPPAATPVLSQVCGVTSLPDLFDYIDLSITTSLNVHAENKTGLKQLRE